MRVTVLLCMTLAGLALAPGAGLAQTPDSLAFLRSPEVRLRPGDVLVVGVWPNADTGGEFTIEETGVVYLPYLGAVQAANVPLQTLRQQIREGYATVVQNPVVTVTPRFGVTVLGAVRVPGNYVVTPTNNLFDLVGLAGGFTEQADLEHITLRRQGRIVELSALGAMEGEIGELTGFSLNSGDQLYVAARGRGIPWGALLTLAQTALTFALLIDRLNRN